MRAPAHDNRSSDALREAVVANCLCYGVNVRLVKREIGWGSTVPTQCQISPND